MDLAALLPSSPSHSTLVPPLRPIRPAVVRVRPAHHDDPICPSLSHPPSVWASPIKTHKPPAGARAQPYPYCHPSQICRASPSPPVSHVRALRRHTARLPVSQDPPPLPPNPCTLWAGVGVAFWPSPAMICWHCQRRICWRFHHRCHRRTFTSISATMSRTLATTR